MTLTAENKVLWSAQPGPQEALIACPVFEVFYGGARGGGKTESSIGDWMEHWNSYRGAVNGAFFRRNRSDLSDVIARTKQLFPHLGAKYNENKSTWTFPEGGRLSFEFLDKDADAQKYQGRSYTRIYVEEATQFPDPQPLWKLKATLRSAAGVPCGMRLTGNPGGPGHVWVKARYITPNPRGGEIFAEEEELEIEPGKTITARVERVFIPSKVWDNKLLLQNDPTYLLRLRQVGSESLVRAWLQGDWDIIEGAFFDEWCDAHVLRSSSWEHLIPREALRFRAFDWGSAKPFSVGWYVVSDGSWGLPRGALLKYREWYGAKSPNVGIKMDNGLIAQGIRERELTERIKYGVADPAIFQRQGGPSIAEQMMIKGVVWRPADNKRIPGWSQLHVYLKGASYEPGRRCVPMLYFLDTCEDTIRTLPLLQHDENNPEDVETEGEDHAGDETRYAVMSRPWVPGDPDFGPITNLPGETTFNQALAMIRKARMERENA